MPPTLEMRGVAKRFGATVALAGVDFAFEAGSVHALVGENGAGKSTLIRVLTGAIRRDAGSVLLDGLPADFRSPQEANRAGVAAVYQEIPLLGRLSVAENLLLGREPTRRGLIDRPRLGAADPVNLGGMMEFVAVAGAVIGGTPLRGGRARPLGTAAGVLILGLIGAAFNMNAVPFAYGQMLQARLILAAVAAQRPRRG